MSVGGLGAWLAAESPPDEVDDESWTTTDAAKVCDDSHTYTQTRDCLVRARAVALAPHLTFAFLDLVMQLAAEAAAAKEAEEAATTAAAEAETAAETAEVRLFLRKR
jgi:hypothetical protein